MKDHTLINHRFCSHPSSHATSMEGSGRLKIVQKEPAQKVGPAMTASWRLANPNRPVPVPDQHGGGPGAYADLGLPPAPPPPPTGSSLSLYTRKTAGPPRFTARHLGRPPGRSSTFTRRPALRGRAKRLGTDSRHKQRRSARSATCGHRQTYHAPAEGGGARSQSGPTADCRLPVPPV